MRHIVVVGAGASGIMAAITAARNGARVTLIEQKNQIGKKILATGNGRCNLTNEQMDVSCFRGENISFIPDVLSKFGYKDTIHFFEKLGVLCKSKQGYIYPITDQASTIVDALQMEINQLPIQILLNETVVDLYKNKQNFFVKTTSKTLRCDVLILATGGKATPVLGSDGSGYTVAKQFGHHMTSIVPALVQLKCKEKFFKQLAGIRMNAKISIIVNDNELANDVGELQLTAYGISGIPVFQVSRYAAKALCEKQSVSAVLDYFPTMNNEEFDSFMRKRIDMHGSKNAFDFFVGLFQRKFISVLLKEAQISESAILNQLSVEELNRLFALCKKMKVTITDTNGFENAQVCAGGVKTSEIDTITMESLYESNLFITGELLDVDGICGGYNLQWAWSTGYIAGINAAKGTENASNRTT